MENNLFVARELSFSYFLGKQPIKALTNVSLKMKAGEVLGLAGPSGSGKSTLLNCLGFLEPVPKEKLYFNGIDVSSYSEKENTRFRLLNISYIFQSFLLFPNMSARENVDYFVARQGVERKERQNIVDRALEDVGLSERANQRPSELSGGQRQRVAIARAIAKRPSVIIADEPTASLDQKTGSQIMDVLFDLNRKRGVSLIISSHDTMVLERLDNVIYLKDGFVVPGGSGVS